MTHKKEKTINTSAQSSAFGWDFQSNLALYFVVTDLKSLKSVKVEGLTEDIELYYEDGRKVFLQAKSQMNPYSSTNSNKHLNAGIKTLINASLKTDYTSLYYGTNISNPFVYREFQSMFIGGPTDYSFNELTEKIKNKIKKNVDSVSKKEKLSLHKFDYNRLRICTLPFYGDEDSTRYRFIKEKTELFLTTLGISRPIINRIFDYYQLMFSKNPSRSVVIDKKELAWPIIIFSIDVNSDEFFSEFDLDVAEEDAVENIYQGFIERKAIDFSLITDVNNDFFEFSKKRLYTSKRNAPSEFIDVYSKIYCQKIFFNESNEMSDAVTKLIMWKIIKKNKVIKKIWNEVGL